MKKDQQYITTRKAAELLGVSVRTAQIWANTGVLRSWKTAGGHRRIIQGSVDELLEKRMKDVNEDSDTNKRSKDKLTILLVEDNVRSMKLFKKQIKLIKSPLKLLTANDGYSALLEIGQCKPDLIITDLMMPGMDGFRMIQAIKKEKWLASTQFIVVTALNPQDIERNGGLPDDIPVLQKPVLFEALEENIKQCFETIQQSTA